MKLEDQFITALLENKITLENIADYNFEPSWMRNLGDCFEFIDNYYAQNSILPSVELVATRFPLYKYCEVTDNIQTILETLRESTKTDRWERDLRKAYDILSNTGKVEKSIEFMGERVHTHSIVGRNTVWEITSPQFNIGTHDYTKRRDAFENNGMYGIPTGFGKELDGFMNGGYQEGMIGWIGESGVSKTWCVEKSGFAALNVSKNVLMVMLEGGIREYNRMLTIATEISNSGITAGKLPMEEYIDAETRLRDLAKERNAKIWMELMGEREVYTPADLRKSINKYRPDIIILDYLTLMKKGANAEDTYSDYLFISQSLALMAKGYHIPIVPVLQGTISADKRGNDITMANIATSKGMARDFDILLGITREQGINNIIRINDAKARDGIQSFSANYKVNWDSGSSQFLQYSTGDFII